MMSFDKFEKAENKSEIAEQIVLERVLTAAVESPQIITGNYSALMACLNEVLTNTVAITSGEHLRESPIHLIAEPMWLDLVDKSYDQELWGQSIDAFPPAIQQFAQDQVKPAIKRGEKLTWGQVRDLRRAMLDCLKKAKGFTVYEGEIKKVEESSRDGSETDKELKIQFTNRETLIIPFTGQPIVLDLSQRPRPAGNALSGEPTVLYRQSREKNESMNDVPIFCAGAGAQAAWVLEKMDNKRTYHIIYRGTLDFRIANAVLGEQRYTAAQALVSVNDSPLKEKLAALQSGTLQQVTYKKDEGQDMVVNISVYPGGGNATAILIKATAIPEEPNEARAYLEQLGLASEKVGKVLDSISQQMEKRREEGLSQDQLAIQLWIDPLRVDVGFAINATGWVSLKETVGQGAIPFWGASAQVSTGDELLRAAKLITTSSLLPGSGLPRMLAMKNRLWAAPKGENNRYDVRALAFTGSGFEQMCQECGFLPGFKEILMKAIQQLSTPEEAQPSPEKWIIEKYENWLDDYPPEPMKVAVEDKQAPSTPENIVQVEKEYLLSKASKALDNNIEENEEAGKGMRP